MFLNIKIRADREMEVGPILELLADYDVESMKWEDDAQKVVTNAIAQSVRNSISRSQRWTSE